MADTDEPTTRLKMAKILQDYKDGAVDYIRTAQALEALIANERREAAIKALIGLKGSPLGMVSQAVEIIDERIAQLQPNSENTV